MKAPKRTILIFIIFLSGFAGNDLYAQWKKIAQSLVAPVQVVPQSFGAIHYKDGMLWAGWKDLWRSVDMGATWTQCNTSFLNGIGDIITDINFFDKNNGLLSTVAGGIFISADGGLNWNKILNNPNGVLNIAFIGSINTIYALSVDGVFSVSFNRGASWQNSRPGADFGVCFTEAIDKTIYVLSTSLDLSGERGEISASTDKGVTWTLKTGVPDGDSYSICADSCDAQRIYISNEDHQSTVNNLSDLYYSPDAGNTCVSAVAFPIPYLTGGMTCSKNAVFASSLAKGIYRSTDKGQSWKNIGGVIMPNPKDNGMAFDARNIACVNDNIIYLLDIEGSIWQTNNSGGDSLIEPIIKLVFSADTLFQNDSLSPCDSPLSRFVKFTAAGCPTPQINNMRLEGNVTAYTTIPAAGDSLGVSFAPKAIGALDADLILTLSNGLFDTLRLKGFGKTVPLKSTFIPDSLFQKDILTPCDSPLSKFVTFIARGCPPPQITSVQIEGNTNPYAVIPVAGDSLGVRFTPGAFGNSDANIIISLTNGEFDTVRLKAVVSKKLLTASLNPDTLFKFDSAFTCDSVINKKIFFKSSPCYPTKISSSSLGGDASSYEIVSVPDSLSGDDSVTLTLRPSVTGKLNGELTLVLDDGNIFKMPLSGYGIPAIPLTINVQDQTADTIGGSVIIPISVTGLQNPEDVTLVVHYDPRLLYNGSYSLTSVKLDIPGEQWIGRSKILIPNATSGVTIAKAYFDVFNDSSDLQKVWFDSMTIITAVPPCRYATSSVLTYSTVNPVPGCGSQILSRFMHFGEMPQFKVMPNPTGAATFITSSANLGEVKVTIFDMLGAERGASMVTLSKDSPAKIELPFPSGLYVLRMRSTAGIYDLRIVVSK